MVSTIWKSRFPIGIGIWYGKVTNYLLFELPETFLHGKATAQEVGVRVGDVDEMG